MAVNKSINLGCGDLLGQKTMAESAPVVIASDQSGVPISGTVTVSNFPATVDTNYGTPGASTVRTAAMLGVGSTAVSSSNPVPSTLIPGTSGGLLVNRVISAATTNATSAKASAGQVYGYFLSNINAAPAYLKLYNKASAPTVGTDTPVMTILIPGNAAGAGANCEFANGIAFATGIAYAITTGVTDASTGAVAANEVVINLLYK